MQNKETFQSMEDKNTWVVVYYKNKDTGDFRNQQEFEEALKIAEMGCLPDFWINDKDLCVKIPPVKTDRQLDAASKKRLSVQNNWNEYPILKIRWDSVKSNYDHAMEMLLICEDHSSGAEEAFAALNDKKKRHARHRKTNVDDENDHDGKSIIANGPSDTKNGKGKRKIKDDENSSMNSLPSPPTQNMSDLFSIDCEQSESLKNLSNNCNERKNEDGSHMGDCTTEVQKKKPRIVGTQHIFPKVIIKKKNNPSPKDTSDNKSGNNRMQYKKNDNGKNNNGRTIKKENIENLCKNLTKQQNVTISQLDGLTRDNKIEYQNSANGKSADIGNLERIKRKPLQNINEEQVNGTASPLPESEYNDNQMKYRNSANSKSAGDCSSKQTPKKPSPRIDEDEIASLLDVSECLSDKNVNNNTLVVAVTKNLLTLNKKMNVLLDNQQQIITNQAKEKILGSAIPSEVDAAWNEKKRVMAGVFEKMTTLPLFLEFDKELGSSKILRARVTKYLKDKTTHDMWQVTAHDTLNAVMHLNVQVLYSCKGQKGKKRLDKTNLYQLLQGAVREASRKKGKITVSDRQIDTCYSNYLKGAPKKLKDRAKASKNKSSTVSVAKALLFGLPETSPASTDKDDSTNDGIEGDSINGEIEGDSPNGVMKGDSPNGATGGEVEISDADRAESKAMIESMVSQSVFHDLDESDAESGSNNDDANRDTDEGYSEQDD